MSKVIIFTVLIGIMLIMSVSAFALTKCMFIVNTTSFSAGDNALNDSLIAWGYDVTPVAAGDISFLFKEDYAQYDFIVGSESMNSGALSQGMMKTIPLPLLNLEGWCVKPGALDWQTDRDVNNYPPEPVQIVDNTGHPLAAGFSAGDLVDLTKPTTDEIFIVGSVPQIPIIPIAGLSSDPTKLVIYGIEAGTVNAVGDTLLNRVATIGLHEFSYGLITDDAVKLIKAGMDWVLAGGTAVEGKEQFVPTQFELAQNYPNPFNPTTEIAFSISKQMPVNLEVYNVQGQSVETVVNEELSAGSYSYSFNARNLPSGVYYCKLQSGNEIQTRKMVLLK